MSHKYLIILNRYFIRNLSTGKHKTNVKTISFLPPSHVQLRFCTPESSPATVFQRDGEWGPPADPYPLLSLLPPSHTAPLHLRGSIPWAPVFQDNLLQWGLTTSHVSSLNIHLLQFGSSMDCSDTCSARERLLFPLLTLVFTLLLLSLFPSSPSPCPSIFFLIFLKYSFNFNFLHWLPD